MRLALFYDTETTGLPLFNEPSDDPRQPHLVQLAAALVDVDTRRTVASMDVIVRPDGFAIPDDVSKIHGITTAHAAEVGVPEAMAIAMLLDLWGGNRIRVAHNEDFDARIVRIGLLRHAGRETAERWARGAAQCTARLSTPILKLPPTERMRAAGRFHHKTPNLGEAYRHFTGQELQNAHTALADVQACMAVFFAMQDAEPKQAA